MKHRARILLAAGLLLAPAATPASAQVANHVSVGIDLAASGGLGHSVWGLSLGYWSTGAHGHWYRVDPRSVHSNCWADIYDPFWHDPFWGDPFWHDPWLDPWTGSSLGCSSHGFGRLPYYGWPFASGFWVGGPSVRWGSSFAFGFGGFSRRHLWGRSGWWNHGRWGAWDYGHRPGYGYRRYVVRDRHPRAGRGVRRSPLFGPRYKVDPRVYVTDNGPERPVSKAVPRDARGDVLQPERGRRPGPSDTATRRAKPRSRLGDPSAPRDRAQASPRARPTARGDRPTVRTRPTARTRPAVRTRPTAGTRPAVRTRPTARPRPAVRTKPTSRTRPTARVGPTARTRPTVGVGARPTATARPAPVRRSPPKARPAPSKSPLPKARPAPAKRPAPKVRPARRPPPPKGKPTRRPARRRGG